MGAILSLKQGLHGLFLQLVSGSIRRQLATSFGAVTMLLMLLVSSMVYLHHRNFLYAQGLQQTVHLARALAASSTSWVLANDLAGLQEVVGGVSSTPDLKFAAIVSPNGEVLASTQPAQLGRYFTDAISRRMLDSPAQGQVLLSDTELLDVAEPIQAGGRLIGWVRIEVTHATTNRHLQELGLVGLGFLLAAMVVTVGVSVLLAHRLTRRLQGVVEVVDEVAQGHAGRRTWARGSDEIGRLAQGFNHMLDTLEEQRGFVARHNAELAIYNQVLQQIGEGRPLSASLRYLVQQIRELEHTSCALFLLSTNGQHLQLAATAGIPRVFADAIGDLKVQSDPGSSATAARQRQRVVSHDAQADPLWAPYRDWLVRGNIHSCWSQPINGSAGQVLGVFTLYRSQPGAPSESEVVLIERCAQLAGLAVERHQQEERLRIAATAFEAQEGIYIADAGRTILQVNKAFTEITGYLPDDVVGKPTAFLHDGVQDDSGFSTIWENLERVGHWQGEVINRRKSGEFFPKWLTLTVVHSADGKISHYVGSFFDITERKRAQAEIEKLAFFDPLTGLPNRRMLLDHLELELAACQRSRHHGALIFIDLDDFKTLNDSLGHDMGDLLLRQVAQRLKEHTRSSDTVARLGGDEFVVLLTDLDPDTLPAAREVETVGNKLLEQLHLPYDLNGNVYHGGCSLGVTLFGDDRLGSDELLKRADLALYEAKTAGRNAMRFFDPVMQATINERVALEADLRFGLEQGQLLLHYQPQVDQHGVLVGAEALLRWQHPVRGMVSPAKFIPLAEQTGLILSIGRWVLQSACHQLALWAKNPKLARLTLSINVSALQFAQKNFVAEVLDALDLTGANADLLKIELTESMLAENIEEIIRKMTILKGCGVGFSLDDFGTGYSSLTYLKRLPLDQLKIDKSFVVDASTHANDAAIIETIVALGRSLHINVIAEGVETREQRDLLARLGCYRYQGYYFGRPGPAEELSRFTAPH